MTTDHTYNASFDYVRLVAVLGIIWFHSNAPGGRIGYSGLAFFLLLLVWLALPCIGALRPQAHRAPALLRYAATRGRRLLLPWLIAGAFYGGLKLLEVSRGAPLASEFTAAMWLTGPALHLWFLPFAFAVSVALWPLGRACLYLSAHQTTSLAAGIAVLGLGALSLTQPGPLLIPLAQWSYALPIVLLGTALALLRQRPWVMLGLLAVFIGTALCARWTQGLTEITLASALLILCARRPLPVTSLSTWAARNTLGLYLIHPAVMAIVTRAGISPDGSTQLALIVTAGSVGLVTLWQTLAVRHLPAPALFS